MDSIVPKEPSEQFSEGPHLSVAPLYRRAVQEAVGLLQPLKSPLPACSNRSGIVRVHANFTKIIGIYIFCVLVHFPGGPWYRAVKSCSAG